MKYQNPFRFLSGCPAGTRLVRSLIPGMLLVLAGSCRTGTPDAPPARSVWYDEPATLFEEALVLGNGTMGATVFGGVETDSIYLNDATLWTGGPVDPRMNPDAHKYIPLIREALAQEDYRLADSLNRYVQGSFSQSYAPLGTLYLEFEHGKEAVGYRRELDISRAVAGVSYTSGGKGYSREYWVSHPDRVMAIRLEAGEAGSLDFSVDFSSLLRHKVRAEGTTLDIEGYVPHRAEPNYRQMENAVQFDPERGTRFATLVRIAETDGEVSTEGQRLRVSGAGRAVILVSVATSFNGFDRDPVSEGKDYRGIAGTQLEAASDLGYANLRSRHTEDYSSFFRRVDFRLGGPATGDMPEAADLPTDERLRRYSDGAEDPGLEELYFQFGRYLLISSSRTPGVPANLQGIWNPYMRPPWSSNYTMNINVEENYWMSETANLPEMHLSLLGFIGNLARTGEVTASTFYGVDRGWTACHNSDIWAMSNPVGDFGQGDPVWACWNMAGAWLSTHLWEHYLFTMDREYLAGTAYPLMKGAALFCLDWLVEGPDGTLVTSPSTSPENLYLTEDGYRGATLYGGTSDLAMIRELFTQTLRACRVLETDPELAGELETALERLHPYRIGKHGQLLEWYHDWEDADPQHRHQSHLFGLYPGHHITPEGSPELAGACRKTLEIKGLRSTGWSQGWRVNLWARLKDGDMAYRMYRQLLSYVDPTGLDPNYSNRGGTYPNLLDAHPPFQIDGNFGGAAGVLEMLVQSAEDRIELLPALPEPWAEGELTGVRTRGGFELSLQWKDHSPKKCIIRSETGGNTLLVHRGIEKQVSLAPGQQKEIRW